MRINREEFLRILTCVDPGRSPRDIIEQSGSFVFKGGKVWTYNDEVSCSHPCPLKLTGAVPGQKLLDVLQKLGEEELEVETRNGEMLLKGKGRRSGIRMDAEIILPVEEVPEPDRWRILPEGFTEAIELVHKCAGKDESMFANTCIHFHPKWIEASDNDQAARYRVKTGFKESVLVRQRAVRHVPPLGVNEVGLSEEWIHFRNPAGLMISCRRYLEGFPSIKELLTVGEGAEVVVLPRGLAATVEKAEIFSSDNTDENFVSVELRPGRLRVRGEGPLGWYSEGRKVSYEGRPFKFLIPPEILAAISAAHREVKVSEERIKATGPSWSYSSVLYVPEGNGDGEEEVAEEEKEGE